MLGNQMAAPLAKTFITLTKEKKSGTTIRFKSPTVLSGFQSSIPLQKFQQKT